MAMNMASLLNLMEDLFVPAIFSITMYHSFWTIHIHIYTLAVSGSPIAATKQKDDDGISQKASF